MLHGLMTHLAVLLTVACLALPSISAALASAHFEGRVVVEWLSNVTPERDMRLLEPFAFVDDAGKRWHVPAGAIINGASIPQSLWSLAGSPYTGNYRRASVVHDYYCDKRSEPWEQVHRMFYAAMIAGGVSELQAKVYYAAVYAGGPRWTTFALKNLEGVDQVIMVPQTTSVPPQVEEDVRAWIRATNPPLEHIEQRLNSEITIR
jgi:Protein of unknown function (DUF1353)